MSAVEKSWVRYNPPKDHPSFLETYFANTRARYVHDDWSVAKAREECIPFTHTIAEPFPGVNTLDRSAKTREKVSKAIDRELNRKRKPSKPDNVKAFLRIRFPKTELRYLA